MRDQGGETLHPPRGDCLVKIDWDKIINCLLLVRLGQELGSDTPLTRAVHDVIDALLRAVR